MSNHKHYILTTSVDGEKTTTSKNRSTPWDKLQWSLASHRTRSPLPPPKNGPANSRWGGLGDPRDLQFQHIWRRVLHDQLHFALYFFSAHLRIHNLNLLQSSMEWHSFSKKWCVAYPTANLLQWLKQTNGWWLVHQAICSKIFASQIGANETGLKDRGEAFPNIFEWQNHLETNGQRTGPTFSFKVSVEKTSRTSGQSAMVLEETELSWRTPGIFQETWRLSDIWKGKLFRI